MYFRPFWIMHGKSAGSVLFKDSQTLPTLPSFLPNFFEKFAHQIFLQAFQTILNLQKKNSANTYFYTFFSTQKIFRFFFTDNLFFFL